MRNVEAPMIVSVATSVFFRLTRSPRCPKMKAPIGRNTYPTPSTAKDWISAAVGSPAGKNTRPKISDAAVVYTKKS